MVRAEKRLEDIVKGLSVEDKGRLVVEDLLRREPVLSPANYRKMLDSMSSDEGHRFNAFLRRFETLRRNLMRLEYTSSDILKQLLKRDRFLWYYRALVDVEEAIVFRSELSDPLLVKNLNLKPGKTLLVKTMFGEVRLGVSGKKRRPFGAKTGVELNEGIVDTLTLIAAAIRGSAGDLKALYRYVTEEAQVMGLDFIVGIAMDTVQEVAEHDRLLNDNHEDLSYRLEKTKKASQSTSGDEPPSESLKLPASVFYVEDRWALKWYGIEEDEDTSRRVREDPEDWMLARIEDSSNGDLLDNYKTMAETYPGGL